MVGIGYFLVDNYVKHFSCFDEFAIAWYITGKLYLVMKLCDLRERDREHMTSVRAAFT